MKVVIDKFFKESIGLTPKIIDVDDMEVENYQANILYLSKENKRYCFMQKSSIDFKVGMGRGDVPRTDPNYSKNTGAMPYKQAQRVMYDFMRGE